MQKYVTLDELKQIVKALGIEDSVERVFTKADHRDRTPRENFCRALQHHYLNATYKGNPPTGLEAAIRIPHQLAFRAADGHPLREQDIYTQDWVWEEKLNGHRAHLCLERGQVSLFSRETDSCFLPLSLHELTPFLSFPIEIPPQVSCVLDVEIVVKGNYDSMFHQIGVSIGSAGDVITALLEFEEAMQKAREWNVRLEICVLDVLEHHHFGSCLQTPLTTRILLREQVQNELALYGIPTILPKYVLGDRAAKQELYNECVRQGDSGCIAKHLSSEYQPGKRPKTWVKVKHNALTSGDTPTCHFSPDEAPTDLAELFSGLGLKMPCDITVQQQDGVIAGRVTDRA